ncbi:hypothetical protein [Streptomyces sp. NPDC127036]|uniref:hypothetical protein n=1 Tax=Streptomyces sp. NPDC127036 TaxID=3347112 RepID=UPI0036597050
MIAKTARRPCSPRTRHHGVDATVLLMTPLSAEHDIFTSGRHAKTIAAAVGLDGCVLLVGVRGAGGLGAGGGGGSLAQANGQNPNGGDGEEFWLPVLCRLMAQTIMADGHQRESRWLGDLRGGLSKVFPG